jgi:signal transduction histidine kinase/ActR/RegA family two-component response regulator/PAS domain-containing protein
MKLKWHLIALVLAALLPVLIFSGLMFRRQVDLQRDAVLRGMLDTARALSLAVDQEIGIMRATLETLANSSYLDARDFKSFYDLCAQAVAWDPQNRRIILFDRSGQQIINTSRPFGQPLPNSLREPVPQPSDNRYPELPVGAPDSVKQFFQGEFVISDMFIALSSNRPSVTIGVPVRREDDSRIYALAMSMEPTVLTGLLLQQYLPADWLGLIVDRRGIVISRTIEPERFIGRPATAELTAQAKIADEAWGRPSSPEEGALYQAYVRSNITGWIVSVGAPQGAIDGPLLRSEALLASGGVIFLLLSLGAALSIGKRIGAPISTLAASADAIQRGEGIDLKGFAVREVKALHEALLLAGAAAREGSMERERRLIAEARELEAEAAKEKVVEILESQSDGFCAFDSGWRLTYVNGRAKAELARQNLQHHELLGKVLWQAFPEQVGTRWYHALQRAMSERVTVTCEFYYPPLDEWYEDRAYPMTENGVALYRRNITDRKRTEIERAALNARLESEVADLKRLHNLSMRLLDQNDLVPMLHEVLQASMELLGADKGNIQIYDESERALKIVTQIGFDQAFLDFFRSIPAGFSACGAALERRARVLVEDAFADPRSADLAPIYAAYDVVALQSTPLFGSDGKLFGMLSTHFRQPHRPSERELQLLDLYAQQAERVIERKRAEDALREVDRRKDQFLALLGHELRNPLGIIRNSAQLLGLQGPADSPLQEWRDTIERQVVQMARMLDDLLDVSRISSGRMQLRKERCDLAKMVRDTAEDYRNSFDLNGVRFALHVTDLPACVVGDRTRLVQAFDNLISNAAKFTDRGGSVTVTLELQGDATAVVSVRDTGMGIEPEVLTWLFEPFTQADRSVERSRGGLGLGLALVKGIVELHGGNVTASSDGPDRGSEFIIRLPLEQAQTSPAIGVVPTQKPRPCRILLIEDNPTAARSGRMILEYMGHAVEVAHTGPEGLMAARSFRPEVVLCDIGLPGLDGYEVAKTLRQQVGLDTMYLVGISGYAQDERRARESGFNAYLTKPVNFDDLERMLAQLKAEAEVESGRTEAESTDQVP